MIEERREARRLGPVDRDLTACESERIDGEHGRTSIAAAYTRPGGPAGFTPTCAIARARSRRGRGRGRVARVLSRAWGESRRDRSRGRSYGVTGFGVVAVGGATLGGSGKTPLAIACARELAASGARVALVATPTGRTRGVARVVRVNDDLAEVGDEAIVCARALARLAPVVVAPTRQAALDHAADARRRRRPRRSLADGAAESGPRPARARRRDPVGGGRGGPAWGPEGTRRRRLLDACDRAVPARRASRVPRRAAPSTRPRLLPWAELVPCLRVGLFLALARPEPGLASLARRGIVPLRASSASRTTASPRGRPFASRGALGQRSNLWLASPKCAVHLEAAGVPHAALEHTVLPSAALRRRSAIA